MRLTSTKFVNASLILTQCLNMILQKHASPKDVIALTTDRTVKNFQVLRLDIRKGRLFSDFQTRFPDYYVIEISSETNLAAFLKEIINNHRILMNYRSRFLFIGTNLTDGYYRYIFDNFLINSIFLDIPRRIIYTFNLYINGRFRKNGGIPFMLGECNPEFKEYENFHEVKIPRRGEKHEMTIAYYEGQNNLYREYVNYKRPGLEIEIIAFILEYLNVNYSFIPINRSQMDTLGKLEDLRICGCQVSDYFLEQETASYHLDHVKWLVPVPEKIERWRHILMVFSPICWILFLSGLLSISIVFLLAGCTDLHSVQLGIVQVLYLVFLGRRKRFRTKYISLDILIFCIIFWSVMFNYLFSSKWTYLLNGISYEKGIESTEDIAKNQFFIVIREHQKRWLRTVPEFRDYPDYLLKPWPKIAVYWGDIPGHNHRVTLMSSGMFRLEKKLFTDRRTGLKYLKELEPPFMTLFVGALFQRGHPFFDVFNRHVRYFIESGLSKRIIKHYEAANWEQPTMEPTQKLNMEHIQAPLMILAVGLMLSLLAFFFELTQWKYSTRSIR